MVPGSAAILVVEEEEGEAAAWSAYLGEQYQAA
jgi:hypothetical protein